MKELERLEDRLKKEADVEKAKLLSRYFKTRKGEYGEGDIFLGLTVPRQRAISKDFFSLDMDEIQELLSSEIHEKRMISLFILTEQYKKAKKEKNESRRKEIFEFYLKNAKQINNWDLVDLSAPGIVGDYLLNKKENRKILYKLVKSKSIWERRIAVLATFMFIRNNKFSDSLKLAEILLKDKHDLIHKAVGWMLREIGKRNRLVEEEFLKKHYRAMPRTMLRYAIEKFPESERRKFLDGEI
jgi:3-methyladenine DNA glycosylase AlkD